MKKSIKITEDSLKRFKLPKGVLEYYLKVNKPELKDFCDQCIKDGHYDWAVRILVRNLSKKHNSDLYFFSMDISLNIFESIYPDEKIPREALETIKKWFENPIVIEYSPNPAKNTYKSICACIDIIEYTIHARDAKSVDNAAYASAAIYTIFWSIVDIDIAKAKTYKKIIDYGLKLAYGDE